MKITKSLTNYAARRGLCLTVENLGKEDFLCFWELENDCEWMFSYSICEDQNGCLLTWRGNIYLPEEIKEELPGTIMTERQLKEMINFVWQNIKK
ncbi:hypothetical protein HOV53_gp146 [Escherichia phage vB_EcoM_Schickermooser]|uniref:Uncharacterized protein n=1 Tax=Escherichia phage vB_EcoM_Schickermooser TaxID=2508195 RepID=A0A482N4N1_9CAUD|nr:hypothetical protein HOV53_gp146 [Escherichia phage vB_EcoM_Schickermooser]QBQ80422.1 hypothetical protein Schickermooser_00279 [Escherichia phage vB_EcoM_Schickermooser]